MQRCNKGFKPLFGWTSVDNYVDNVEKHGLYKIACIC